MRASLRGMLDEPVRVLAVVLEAVPFFISSYARAINAAHSGSSLLVTLSRLIGS